MPNKLPDCFNSTRHFSYFIRLLSIFIALYVFIPFIFAFFSHLTALLDAGLSHSFLTCHTPMFAAGSEKGRLKTWHILKASE